MIKNFTRRVRMEWVPRLSRGTRRAGLLAAIAVVMLAFAAVGTHTLASNTTRKAETARPRVPYETTCQGRATREKCHDVVVDGRSRRYGLLKASTTTADTVIVDLGGPGKSILHGEGDLAAFRSAYPALSTGYNVLVIEEPWVTQALSSDCKEALSRYYDALQSLSSNHAYRQGANLTRQCEVADGKGRWGFTGESYARTVEAIETTERIRVRGFVGYSWGSVRLDYLRKRLDFAALVRPFPVGVTSDQLVHERGRLLPTVKRSIITREPQKVGNRSVAVSPFDRLSAIIELGYVTESSYTAARTAIASGSNPAIVGSLSDQLWKRYGTRSISPGLLAQLDEFCPTMGGMQRPVPTIHSAGDLLAVSFAPCQSVPQRKIGVAAVAKICVVSSRSDTVVPYALVRSVYAPRNAVIVETKDRSHGSFDGLDTCLTRMVPSS